MSSVGRGAFEDLLNLRIGKTSGILKKISARFRADLRTPEMTGSIDYEHMEEENEEDAEDEDNEEEDVEYRGEENNEEDIVFSEMGEDGKLGERIVMVNTMNQPINISKRWRR
ncbi:hypothetical protein BJ742DRAFT_775147 [Cladochytrium replicatum]|nr:hypothetical protein BJ742DRAFT_775147 [Cladochytrium replicatum]